MPRLISFLAILTLLLTAHRETFAQERRISYHARALVSQYHATNLGSVSDPADAFFFAPSLGGNMEAVARWRPDSSRLFVEAGICAWMWHYRAVLNTRTTQTQFRHRWKADNGGVSIGIPLRLGVNVRQMASITAGIMVLRGVWGAGPKELSFQNTVDGETLAAEATIMGINRTSAAFDITAAIQLSPRMDVLLRGALDTGPYPAIEAHHYVTRGTLTRQYTFSGAPKLASVSVGLEVIL